MTLAVLKIVVAMPHPLERDMLILRLAMMPQYAICGATDNESEATQLIRQHAANLVIVDAALGWGTGLDVIKRVKSEYPQTKLLVVSERNDLIYADRMIHADANGYVNKRQPIELLVSAVGEVARGNTVINDGGPSTPPRLKLTPTVKNLSDRELQVFELIGLGHASRAIAKQLNVTRHTIDSHRENIKKKLGLASSAELTRAAVHWQLEPV